MTQETIILISMCSSLQRVADQNAKVTVFILHKNQLFLRHSPHEKNTFLVGGLNPSEKYESQLGSLFPIYGKIKNVPNHQPDECCHVHLWWQDPPERLLAHLNLQNGLREQGQKETHDHIIRRSMGRTWHSARQKLGQPINEPCLGATCLNNQQIRVPINGSTPSHHPF